MVGQGRAPELSEARRSRIELRLHESERRVLDEAALRAGLPLGEWLRVVGLTSAGAGEMLQQLKRVEPSKLDRLDSLVRRRIPELRDGEGTPFWTYVPPSVRHPQVTDRVSERVRYESGIAMFVAPAALAWRENEIWPPSRHAKAMTSTEINEGIAAGRIDSREIHKEIEARRKLAHEMLAMPSLGIRVMHARMYESGYALNAIVASGAIEEYAPVAPHAHAMLRRNGLFESVIALDAKRGAELSLDRIAHLPELLGRELGLLHEIGATTPYLLSLVAFGVQGRTLRGPSPDPERNDYVRGTPIADDIVMLPVVAISDASADPLEVLRRPLDALWQKAGLRECQLLLAARSRD